MAPKNILGLSNEILEDVVSEINLPQDLLNLALASKLFKDIVIPNHIQLRRIRCHIYQDDLWEILTEKPILAANIRSLQIGFGRYIQEEQIVPSMFSTSLGKPKSDSQYFFKALNKMNRLTQFNMNTTSQTLEDDNMLDEIIFAIAEAPFRLQDLALGHLYSNVHGTGIANTDRKISYPAPHLHSLTGLFLSHCDCQRCYPNPLYNALFSISDLPLRNLFLSLAPGRLPGIGDGSLEMVDVLGWVHWPQLQKVTLLPGTYPNAFESKSQMDSLRTFLIRHTKLEAVSLFQIPLPDLPADSLPRLHSLDFHWKGREHTCRLPQSIARTIYHFMAAIEGDEMLDVLKDMKDLRSCKVNGISNIAQLHQFSPYLEKLSYSQTGESSDWEDRGKVTAKAKKEVEKITAERIQALTAFNCLTHLGRFLARQELELSAPRSRQTDMLRELANSIHTLKYVEIYKQGRPTWIRIERDEEGQYAGFDETDGLEKENPRSHTWGDFYDGFRL
ncbi:hypothetical protein M422DRAFT_31314 [Sphaerobolus stellatus SS14]|uniref:F-box domain-containing protein n=1 Tax=Sphaerobolus stellatus (strain SS14) TaxID=990650 RepID=A0A0C9VVL8_SPHS4|nr:hypothetical protein M422DRAFT_31314 [Sphaerobolus stellatus SS14]